MSGSADLPVRRVALVAGTTAGGMGAHVRMLASGLADRGAQVTVLGPEAVARTLEIGRGPAVTFGIVEIGTRPQASDIRAVLELRRFLLAGPGAARPEVVHAHGLRAGALCVLALRAGGLLARSPGPAAGGSRGRPALVVTAHNAPPLAGGWSSLAYRALELIVARGADLVLCVSRDLEARMRAAGARRVGHAVVPGPAMRAPDGRPAGDSLTPDWARGDRPVVLAVGRLVPQKGLSLLLEAAASWRDLDPAPLVVIAGDGPLRAELRDQADGLGVDAMFLGHRDDVPALLAACAVFALPSLWEGQPLALQEALRAGVPIVATRVGGIPDLVAAAPGTGRDASGGSAGRGALLVRARDSRELAAAVRSILTDPALAARLRAAALRRAAALPTEADTVTAALTSYADAAVPIPAGGADR